MNEWPTHVRVLGASCGLALAVLGCGSAKQGSTAAHTTLGGGVAGRVGDVDLPVSLVGAVATQRNVPPSAALALLVDDVVAAKGATARGLDRAPEVQLARTSTVAMATIDRIRAKAHAKPPTDDEVRALSELHWLEVDAPETMEAVHAVAIRPKVADSHAEAAAKAVAAAILNAVTGAVDAADFQARAKAVPHPGVEVVVEALEPFTADGRVAVPGVERPYYPLFTAGAAAIPTPGGTSGIVESSAGWHVIRLIDRHPARRVPFEERRRLFTEEVYARRAHDALAALEDSLRSSERVALADGLDEILSAANPVAPAPEAAPSAPAAP